MLDAVVNNIATLEAALETAYHQHPDAAIIGSFPGLGTVLGARLLGEIGDDRARFSHARGLKAFAGTAPVTRASGMKTVVTMRAVRNKRLGQAAYLLGATPAGPLAGPRPLRPTPPGRSYSAAARNLTNRGLGMLHHCLQTGQLYNEAKAFPAATATSGKPTAANAHQESEAPATETVA
jgi:hypothetical protein